MEQIVFTGGMSPCKLRVCVLDEQGHPPAAELEDWDLGSEQHNCKKPQL